MFIVKVRFREWNSFDLGETRVFVFHIAGRIVQEPVSISSKEIISIEDHQLAVKLIIENSENYFSILQSLVLKLLFKQ